MGDAAAKATHGVGIAEPEAASAPLMRQRRERREFGVTGLQAGAPRFFPQPHKEPS